jgi:hypothetical protein
MKLPRCAPGILILTVALFALRAGPALAQGSKAPVPDLALAWKPKAGKDSLVLVVKVALPAGWYINSQAPLDSFLVPTRVEAAAAPGFAGPLLEFDPPRYPPAVVEHSQALAGNMSLFRGTFEVTLTARGPSRGKARATLPHPPPPVHVTLHYQSCDGNMCWPPKAVSARLVDGVTHGE